MIRRPAVAGSFYPREPQVLEREVQRLLGPERGGEPAVAILVPHAGYIYSGSCAGRTYARIALPGRVILLGPNHTGLGAALALMDSGAWRTPLGEVPIDEQLGRLLLARAPGLTCDAQAHAREHSLEVQLPFLQTLRPDIRLSPICVGTRRLADLLALGDAIADSVRSSPEPLLIVISSDMSHYIPLDEARVRDGHAIERMEGVDAEGLHATVESEGISMCGYCPAVVGLRAARALGARSGRLVAYTSSGDTTGDYSSVVSYAGLIFH